MDRLRVTSGTSWEMEIGYCRAMRVGPHIAVSGTTAIPQGEVVYAGDAAKQTGVVIGIIEQALAGVGARLNDIVRMRVYITRVEDIPAVSKALREGGLKHIVPTLTMVVVQALIDPRLVVEIEADAIVGHD